MAEENAENEPTMEEILASIRAIISEDDEEGGDKAEATEAPEAKAAEPVAEDVKPEPEPEPEPEPAAEAEVEAPPVDDDGDDFLQLTEDEIVTGDAIEPDADIMVVDKEDEAEEPEPEPVVDVVEEEPAPEPEPEPEPVMAAPANDAAAGDEEEILSEASAMAAAGALGTLAQNMKVAQTDGQTIEGILRELLRPMLKAWLDENLPGIVDTKVEEAIDKVVRRTRI